LITIIAAIAASTAIRSSVVIPDSAATIRWWFDEFLTSSISVSPCLGGRTCICPYLRATVPAGCR
jgi:hypothetical protein